MATSRLKLISIFISQVIAQSNECQSESKNSCNNKSAALPLKLIAIVSILITSMIGMCLLFFSCSIPALGPKALITTYSSGIILATGFMHVLPDSFDMLWSPCLKENPWHKFPFTGFVAMLSAIFTQMVDSIATSLSTKKNNAGIIPEIEIGIEGTQFLRYRVVAMVLELGIVVHSVVIGPSMGASNNTCIIKPLVAALCFHQMFEGMGLGDCILQVGLLNASSAGLLIYMALVDLLSAEFMGPKFQGSIKLQIKAYVAVLLGAGGMSLMAKWA
ncbi:hypothetical protein PVL29_013642 [Vitis rotundifolia]|uniref:Uncharacterized protein n=1 Tax=Vitis rotundifolia TaxID=103349 RepID=A0AA39DNT7_VITRO|nr:hypothetical protein PVL29_013642 [Vitis rotundifolia]